MNGVLIEIKTVRSAQWKGLGRMIPPHQLMAAVRQKKIILWVVSDQESPIVELKGWNHATDVRTHGIPIKTRCDNIWL